MDNLLNWVSDRRRKDKRPLLRQHLTWLITASGRDKRMMKERVCGFLSALLEEGVIDSGQFQEFCREVDNA